jgi:hypothetical protein
MNLSLIFLCIRHHFIFFIICILIRHSTGRKEFLSLRIRTYCTYKALIISYNIKNSRSRSPTVQHRLQSIVNRANSGVRSEKGYWLSKQKFLFEMARSNLNTSSDLSDAFLAAQQYSSGIIG